MSNKNTQNKDMQLIEEARQWESVAEGLEQESAVLLTLNEAMALQELPHYQKLLDRTTEVLQQLAYQCREKQQAYYGLSQECVA